MTTERRSVVALEGSARSCKYAVMALHTGRQRVAAKKKASKRKYGAKAQTLVAKTMRARKKGTLKSGGSGQKVKSRKQAIAIALSEARRAGAKVPKQRKAAKKRKGAKRKVVKRKSS
jgi:hypothetical protein